MPRTNKKESPKPGKRKTRARRAPKQLNAAGNSVPRSQISRRGAKGGPSMKVRVRMYRQGLGDSFLITFDLGGTEKHMLIDCGSLGATTTGVKLSDVVADIRLTTKDHIHLLIATHEHWDHVRAFGELAAEFKKIKFDH